jgi:hypothetical protein
MPVMSSSIIRLVDLESGETVDKHLALLVCTHVGPRVLGTLLIVLASCSCNRRSGDGGSSGSFLAEFSHHLL